MANISDLRSIISSRGRDGVLAHVHIPKTAGTTVNRYLGSSTRFFNAEHSSCDRAGRIQGAVKINSPRDGVTRIWPCFYDFLPEDVIIFSVTRNPFPWLLSYYRHRGTRRCGLFAHRGWQGVVDLLAPKSFIHFVELYLDSTSWHFPPLLRGPLGQILDNKGKYHADFILYSETLDESLPYLYQQYGSGGGGPVPRVNVGENIVDYRIYFDDRLAQRVFDRFPEYFEMTGYGFENTFVTPESKVCILPNNGHSRCVE